MSQPQLQPQPQFQPQLLKYIKTDHLSDPSVQIVTKSSEISELLGKIFGGSYGIGPEHSGEADCHKCQVHYWNLGGYFTDVCSSCHKSFCGDCMVVDHEGHNVCQKCKEEREAKILKEKEAKKQEQIYEYKHRIYIHVPDDEKLDAKDLGALWDDQAKCWYAPVPPGEEHEVLELFEPKEIDIAALISGL